MKKKTEQIVKVNQSGRISLILSRSLKPVMLHLIEHSIIPKKASEGFLIKWMRYSLLAEVYGKYYTVLHLDRVNRLLITPAQACALWLAWSDLHDDCDTPELGNLMMQLHQKLS